MLRGVRNIAAILLGATMYVVIWCSERLEEFEEEFEDLMEAQFFMENLPENAKLFREEDTRVERII
jgi:hypothetical protein